MDMTVDVNAVGEIAVLPSLWVVPTRRRGGVGEDWKLDAGCRKVDPDEFFPEFGASARMAKRVCLEVCPVRDECLAYALARNERHGIWGGMSTWERDRHARRLTRLSAAGLV